MTDDERTLIAHRMGRAKEDVEEARLLFDAGHINSYVNRLYYACFYAVSALLLSRNLSTSKHVHLRSLLHREFVRTGLISKESGKYFDMLFDSRQQGDYADFVVFKANEVADWLMRTKEFVSCIESLVSKIT